MDKEFSLSWGLGANQARLPGGHGSMGSNWRKLGRIWGPRVRTIVQSIGHN